MLERNTIDRGSPCLLLAHFLVVGLGVRVHAAEGAFPVAESLPGEVCSTCLEDYHQVGFPLTLPCGHFLC